MKFSVLPKNQPKSHILYQKNDSPRNLRIMTLAAMNFVRRLKTPQSYIHYTTEGMIQTRKNKSSPIEIFVSHILT